MLVCTEIDDQVLFSGKPYKHVTVLILYGKLALDFSASIASCTSIFHGVAPLCNAQHWHARVTTLDLLVCAHLVRYCDEHNITFNGYSPLAANDWAAYYHQWPRSLLNETTLTEIAAAHGRTPAQVALRHQVQLGLVINPRSQNFAHMKENNEIFDFVLSNAEMDKITNIPPPPQHPKVFEDPHQIP